MAGSVTIEVNAAEVVAMLDIAASKLRPVIIEQLAVVSEIVKEVMKLKASVGVGGDDGLRGSIGYLVDTANLVSEIKPAVAYADAVETGSKPHWAPHGPDSSLAAWCKLKGLNVFAVAASIAKKGTKPHPYIIPTYEETAPQVSTAFAAGIGTFVEGLAV